MRLERASDERWPAYRGTFPLTLWWIANRHPVNGIDALPKSRAEAVNFCVAAARYSAHTVWANDPAVLAERDWWQAWSQRAASHDEPAGHVAAIREALEHIEHLPDQTPQDESGDEQGDSAAMSRASRATCRVGRPAGRGASRATSPATHLRLLTGRTGRPGAAGLHRRGLQVPRWAGRGHRAAEASRTSPTSPRLTRTARHRGRRGRRGCRRAGDGAGEGGDEPQPEADGLKEPLPLEIDEDLTADERLRDCNRRTGPALSR